MLVTKIYLIYNMFVNYLRIHILYDIIGESIKNKELKKNRTENEKYHEIY
jgi:hypothetical protein